MSAALAFVRLLQLASPTLPVGAYTYSQGLGQAIDRGRVADEPGATRWIGDAMAFGVARWEAPAVGRLLGAWREGDDATVARIDADFVASRESAELRAETLQMGHSLARLLAGLPAYVAAPGDYAARLAALRTPAFPTAWSAAAAAWDAPAGDSVVAYLWAWLENQVMAAVKAVPLGQSAGQRMLAALGARIPELAARALLREEDGFANFTPGLAIASAAHETQYSRLFRS
jgi:urease accessory protein